MDSILEIQNKINTSKISLAGYVKEFLERAVDDHFNSIINYDPNVVSTQVIAIEKRREAGEILPLYGAVLGIKDNIDTVCYPTTGGTPALLDHRPKQDADVITTLIQAGAVIAAKTNMHELAFGVTSNNACTGAVKNPYDQDLISGGSSGGAAASIAAGIFNAGLGTDTGGSCRIPLHFVVFMVFVLR